MTAYDGEHGPDEPAAPSGAASGGAEPADGFVLHLPTFDGPLDLLLHLIEREELDVTELSVLAVTEQYLAHLRAARQTSLSALAEFVAMGARLVLLKSRALLPRDETEAEAEDGEDDAAALVAALEEYRRYRRAAEHLRGLEDEHRTGYRREAAPPEVSLPSGLDEVTLDALVEVFRQVLERTPPPEEQAEVERDPVRLADRVAAMVDALDRDGHVAFRRLVERAETRLEVIVDFLAVLELIKARFLEARQPDAFGEIELLRIEGAVPPGATALAETLDDAQGGGT